MQFLVDFPDFNSREELNAALSRAGFNEDVVASEKDMVTNGIFTKNDILMFMLDNSTVLHDRAWALIEGFGKDAFLGRVIQTLNKDFDANEGINWSSVNDAIYKGIKYIHDNYDVEKLLKSEKAVSFLQSRDTVEISLDGLRQALERYNDSGREGSCGSWHIHSGGYDKWWEASYDRTSAFSCEASGEYDSRGKEYGNLVPDINLSDKMFKEICDMVHSEFPECRMDPQEQKKIQETECLQGR